MTELFGCAYSALIKKNVQENKVHLHAFDAKDYTENEKTWLCEENLEIGSLDLNSQNNLLNYWSHGDIVQHYNYALLLFLRGEFEHSLHTFKEIKTNWSFGQHIDETIHALLTESQSTPNGWPTDCNTSYRIAQKNLELNPYDIKSGLKIIHCNLQQKKIEKAYYLSQFFKKAHPHLESINRLYAYTAFLLEHYDESIKKIEELLTHHHDDIWLHELLGEAGLKVARINSVKQGYGYILEHNPQHTQALMAMAWVHWSEHRLAESANNLRAALKTNDHIHNIKLFLAILNILQGCCEEETTTIINSLPKDAGALKTLQESMKNAQESSDNASENQEQIAEDVQHPEDTSKTAESVKPAFKTPKPCHFSDAKGSIHFAEKSYLQAKKLLLSKKTQQANRKITCALDGLTDFPEKTRSICIDLTKAWARLLMQNKHVKDTLMILKSGLRCDPHNVSILQIIQKLEKI
jgi:tetratricopeptide (TPR) repeat protein